MIVLKIIFVIIACVIIIIIGKITWHFFPHMISRRDKYRNSTYDIMKLRFARTVAAIVIALFISWVVYGLIFIAPSNDPNKTVKENIEANQVLPLEKEIDDSDLINDFIQCEDGYNFTKLYL